MNNTLLRRFFKFISILTITILVLGAPGMGTQVAYAATNTVTDVPPAGTVLIPDAPPSPNCTNRSITFPVNVIIADIDVGLNISHSRRSDVRVTLESPAGTIVELISGGGLGSPVASPDDYDNYDVLLDDSSINSLYDNDIDNVGVPFYDRNARPFEALSAFKGENTVGATPWILSICDTRNGSQTGALGIYNNAQLTVTSADPNTVSGIVFTDYNDNGVREQGDIGVPGVTVTAYDATGNQVAPPTTTLPDGSYTFMGAAFADGTQLRIEFTNIPFNLRPGAFGVDSGTTVQFVTSPAAGVDLGLAKPDEYCQSNPFLVSPCYINGNPLDPAGTADDAKVLVSIPYDAYGRQDDGIENTLATGGQIGTTWGLAFQRSTGTIFAGALAKRHAGLGPDGAGAIYSLVMNPTDGTGSTTPALFVDLAALGIPTGGAILGDNFARGLPGIASQPNTDPTAWDAVGKVAIGDMDMGTDDTTLWVMNLANQTLYAINVNTLAFTGYSITQTTLQQVGAAACPAASDVRPWAVEVYRGRIYVGVVCSAQSTQNVGDLRAYVLSMDESGVGGFSLVTQFALNYDRGFVTNPTFVGNPVTGFPADWRPWIQTMTSLCAAPCATQANLAFGKQIIYPQPILADVEFDTNGDLILGFMDRLGHQTGNANYATSNPWGTVTVYNKDTYATSVATMAGTDPVTGLVVTYEGVSAGDTIRLCSNGAGGFILENNADCGGIVTGGAGSVPAQGPGGGEYYWQDMHPPSTALNGGIHHETTLGGLLLVPGTNEVAVSVFDPFDLRAGGIAWFNNLTGVRTRAYEVFGIDAGGGAATFGKAAGLGDVEGFCFAAPIEIGNRVWIDSDNDGVQDADETPIAGVRVELYDQAGNFIAFVVTDANGNYFFSSGPGSDSPNHEYLLDDLNPLSNYEIRIPLGQPALAGLTLTINDSVPEDQRDSDGIANLGNAVVTITTGSAGDNNHTYDFGFTGSYSLGNRVWLDDGSGGGLADNGVQDGTEVGIANVVVNLYRDTNNDGIPDGGIIDSVTTDANGYYRFDNLTAGGYVVEIPAVNFNSGNPLFSLSSSSPALNPDETNPNSDEDIDDNGIGVIPDVLNGIRSGTVNLGPGTTEPLAPAIEVDVPTTGPFAGQGAPDARANMTVDFGFVPSYSIGNRVWFDTDNDSIRDDTGVPAVDEVGVDDVFVQLYSVDAQGNFTLVATTTTADGGYYRFDGLPAGDYVVVIPEDNFRDVGPGDLTLDDPLRGYWSSGTTIDNAGNILEAVAALANSDDDDDDNGMLQNAPAQFAGAVISSVATLGPGLSEPTNEVDLSPTGQGAINERANMTVDFGFYRLELGDLVFEDVNNNGTFDAGDFRLPSILVQLFAADGTTEIITGADGIPGTADDGLGPDGFISPDDGQGGIFTDFNGNYLFSGLPQGNYVVQVTGPVGYTSTIDTFDIDDNGDPNFNRDDNDNGIGTGAGVVSSGLVALIPGSTGAAPWFSNTVTQSTGTTRNPTVDFGFVQANAGIIKSVTPPVATIGELVTYTVQVLIPPGTFTNAQMVDRMDRGLALFDCQPVVASAPTLTTTIPPGDFSTICPNNVTTNDTGTGLPEDIDREVVFSLGDVINAGQTDATLTFVYRAIILDVATNVGTGNSQTVLDNSALFSWIDTNGTPQTLGPVTRPVTVIEPDLQIVKTSNTNFVAVGTAVEFTLTVTHTANSRADAFDVIITDVLPAELDYVANSIDCDDGNQSTPPNLVNCTYDIGTRTIIGEWSTFTRLPAGDELIIRFSVTGNALLGPGQTITNVGNVQWTSELGDQTPPASFSNPPNPFATERFYDPASAINVYGDSDPLVLNPVGGGGGGGGTSPTSRIGGFLIPVTGFAPGRQTLLDERSALYAPTTLAFEIPAIKVKSTIAGVQLKDGNWDVSWLQDQAGWLEGTAYPTWSGNSVLTAHTVNADGKPGLFSRLKYLRSGEYIFVYNSGYRYTYKVVSNEYVQPDDISVLQHEDSSTITLITCDRYDGKTGTYLRRVVVRAVLVDVSLVK